MNTFDNDGDEFGNGTDPMASSLPTDQQKSGVQRDTEDTPDQVKELVTKRIADVKRARKFWDKDFKRMRKNMDMLIGIQWEGQTSIDDEDRYIANIIQRHVQQRTAAVYAKNPTVVARRKEMMDFMMWDENPLTFQMAQQAVQMANQVMAGAQMGNPQAVAQAQMSASNPQMMQELMIAKELLSDITQGFQRRAASDRICRTVQLYFKNKVLAQQYPPFKASMKQTVRRTMATGVGYVKLSVVRGMEMSPDVIKGMATLQEQMATIQNMMANIIDKDPQMAELTAETERLRLAMDGLQKKPEVISQEGLMFDFPSSTSIIPDWRMQQLQGFVGCEFVAEEFMLSAEQIQKIFKVDVGKNVTKYSPENSAEPLTAGTEKDKEGGVCCCWLMYDRTDGLTYWLCDGYDDFLEPPAPPKLSLERFFPWFPLAFNYIEHHKQKFPLSDAHLLEHQQREYNRARQGLREQRIANRPATVVPAGALDKEDEEKLQTRPANAVIKIKALAPGQKVEDILQTLKHPAIDPANYDTTPTFQDVLRVAGTQEANLGGTSNSTATESSIAESSRMSSLQSNMDDMDDFLSELMRAAGQAAFLEISAEEVKSVVGPGASWPSLSAQDAANEYFVEIQAGSSGRPNKSVDVQNLTQLAPILLQIPGLNPQWLAKQILTRMDDRLDLTEAFLEGQPSIQTLNALAAKPLGQAPTEPDGDDPNAQGGEGDQNAEGASGTPGALGPMTANAAPPAPAASAPVPIGA